MPVALASGLASVGAAPVIIAVCSGSVIGAYISQGRLHNSDGFYKKFQEWAEYF